MELITKRPVCPGAEELVNVYFPVLDHGFIALIDYMGGADSIERAARVSTATEPLNAEDSVRLVRQLAREGHRNPGEMFRFEFHVRAPIFVARQWVRTRCASWNELSGRYRSLDPLFYDPELVRFQDKRAPRVLHVYESRDLLESYGIANATYEELVGNEWERGLARIPLPQSTYTEWIWSIDFSNLTQFIHKRDDEHAQWEIQQYAHILGGMVAESLPVNWKAFCDYELNAVKFSAMEMGFVRDLFANGSLVKADDLDAPDRKALITKLMNGPRDMSRFDLDWYRTLSPDEALATKMVKRKKAR